MSLSGLLRPPKAGFSPLLLLPVDRQLRVLQSSDQLARISHPSEDRQKVALSAARRSDGRKKRKKRETRTVDGKTDFAPIRVRGDDVFCTDELGS